MGDETQKSAHWMLVTVEWSTEFNRGMMKAHASIESPKKEDAEAFLAEEQKKVPGLFLWPEPVPLEPAKNQVFSVRKDVCPEIDKAVEHAREHAQHDFYKDKTMEEDREHVAEERARIEKEEGVLSLEAHRRKKGIGL
jgi:hypothetical protein